jgi:two-component system response regulator FixJ
MFGRPLILVVDDNAQARDSLRKLLETASYRVRDYPSAKAFLADEADTGSCLITDIRMPEMDGLALLEELIRRGFVLPVIVVAGHADVPLAVRAMKAGAVDFIEKPLDDEIMLASVQRAVEVGRRFRNKREEARVALSLLALLTPRECDVLGHLVAGRSNKLIAQELGISPRTAWSLLDIVLGIMQEAHPRQFQARCPPVTKGAQA